MKEYDFIFSMGASCAVSMSLRDAGLQFASWPLDWAASPGLPRTVDMIERDFEHWFEREDLKLWDVRHEEGAVQRIYRNMRTNFGFPHEFTNANPIDLGYEKTRAKYERRIARFVEEMSRSQRVLGIYLEVATRRCLLEAEVANARRRIAAKFPKIDFELLYIYEDPSAAMPEIVAERDGVMTVRAHYGKFLNGVPMHTVDRSQLVGFIHDNFTVSGHHIAAEKAAYEKEQKKLRMNHWGTGRCERWVNRKLFKTYRRLQDYLIEQRLLPGDRPCWFEESDKVWPHGPIPEDR